MMSRLLASPDASCPKSSAWTADLFTANCNWSVSSETFTFTLFIVVLGLAAALWGGWLERAGPRKAGVVAALCWSGGLVLGALGVYQHQLWIVWLGTGVLGGIGMATLCIGMTLLALLPVHPSVFEIGWRMAVCGAGFGFFQAPNLKAIMGSAPASRSGGASGIVATARLLGQTTGAALVALCFTIASTHGAALALALGAVFAGGASIASFSRLFAGTQPFATP